VRPVRAGIYTGLGIVGAAAALCGFVAWLLMTESGTEWLVARIEVRIPAAISIGRIGGTVWHGIDLADVAISTDGAQVDIDAAEFVLDIDNLLRRRVVIDRLVVGGVRYVQRAGGRADTRQPISIPIPISVAAGTLASLTVVLGNANYTVGPAEFSGAVDGDTIVFNELSGAAVGFELRGAGTVVLGEDLALDTTFDWSTTRNGIDYAGRGDAVGNWPTLHVHQDIAAPAELAADGAVTFGSDPNAEFELAWANLLWPWADNVSSAGGHARVVGWLNRVTFDGEAALTVDDLTADVVASGTATPTELLFDRVDAVAPFGRVAASGRVAVSPLTWSFDVRGEDVDPSARFAEWPGALDVVGQLSGQRDPVISVALSGATVAGSLRGRPLEATGSVEFSTPDAWQFSAATLDISGNRLQIDGELRDALDLSIRVDAPDLAAIVDAAAGALTVDGRLTGTRRAPAFRGNMVGRDLVHGAYGARSVALDGEIVADAARSVSLSLDAGGITIGDRQVESLVGRVSGNAGAHVVELDATSEYGGAALRGSGNWSNETWSGTVAALALTEPTLGRWELDAPARLVATRTTLVLERACVSQESASLCASTRIGTAADALEVTLRAFDLASIAAVLPPEIAVTGIYDADLALAGPLRRPAGQFMAHGTNSLITIREPEQPPLEIPIEELRADAELTAAGDLSIEAAFESSNGGNVDVAATVAALWSEMPTVVGELNARWPDLAFLSLLSPDVGEVSGNGNIALAFDGPLREPLVRGSAHWLEGRVEVPRFGLIVEEINAGVTSDDSTELSIDASGKVGSGTLSITGTTQVDADAGWPTELSIFGERLEAVRLPEAQILISPALAVEAALPNIKVSGAFLIPEARLTLDELPPQAAVPSPDTVIHGVEREAGQRPLNVSANIRVGLGENVRYTGAGLDVALAGAMGLTYQSGESAVASGAVTLTGNYQAYGQTLEIDAGRLLFAGPVANPNLDVRAIRKIDETTVGIQLSGTVEAPVSRVFSEPAMAEADALSYLLLGRPLSTTGDEETATLETAAFAMGLQQALPVIQRVGESLGLDEFSVQTTTADTGELMAGKRISPRVYIRYTYGLFNRIGGLLMRFNLNNRLSLETRSGDYRSMDLIYTVERD